jgi:hypothetical protein
MEKIKPERLSFYTDSGLEVEFEPVSPLVLEEIEAAIEAEHRAAGWPIDPPTYEAELAGGGTQTFDHDETTLRNDEEREAWRLHKEALTAMAAEQSRRRAEMILFALKVELPEDDTWVRRLKRMGLQIPEDPDDRLIFYIERFVIRTPNDLMTAMTEVIGASLRGTVSEAQIKAASQTFRDNIQKAIFEAGQAAGIDQGNSEG